MLKIFYLAALACGGGASAHAQSAFPVKVIPRRRSLRPSPNTLHGIGSAAILACSLGLIGKAFPGPALARPAGIWAGARAAGVAMDR